MSLSRVLFAETKKQPLTSTKSAEHHQEMMAGMQKSDANVMPLCVFGR